ncbi:MAG TPA: hypothetical protein VJL78_02205, partial [Candidatus Nitrosocosmicus sp.]|nr:hypothetical protein [Candidatus Nitrosocosmicus sp.]
QVKEIYNNFFAISSIGFIDLLIQNSKTLQNNLLAVFILVSIMNEHNKHGLDTCCLGDKISPTTK